jgi:deoxyguanosine kinase
VNLPYIVIEGNIGAGKTSLATKLATDWNGHLIPEEFADNSFLKNFYKEPERYAFALEMSFLATRYKQLSDEFNKMYDKNLIISDYHIEKSLLFASVNLPKDELKLYKSLFSIIKPMLKKPDLLVYLDNSPAHSMSNIRARNRDFEQEISADYLQSLHESYHNKVTFFSYNKLLTINTSRLDFVNKIDDYERVKASIMNEL